MVVGLINGLGVAYAGVPPIIMTLGMNSAIQGLLLIYTNGGSASAAPPGLVSFVNGDTLGVLDDAADLDRRHGRRQRCCSA